MPTEKTYHHGNLRAALIEQAIIILTADGVSALTLRRLAAEAGVSHGAPAHHFKNKAGLLSAVAAQSFRLFAAAMQREREAADGEAMAKRWRSCGPSPRAIYISQSSNQHYFN